MNVRFKDWDCNLSFSHYANGKGTALVLHDSTTGERIATATINLPELGLAEDLVVIKDYSENEGILEALREAGVVSAPLLWVRLSPWAMAPVCQLLKTGDSE